MGGFRINRDSHEFVEHRLGDEERRLFKRLVDILDRLIVDPNAGKIGELSKDSDKLEVEAKNLADKLTQQNKTGD